MNKLLPILFAFTLISCMSKQASMVAQQTQVKAKGSTSSRTIQTASAQVAETWNSEDEYKTCFVVIADTGNKYEPLRDMMLELHGKLQQPIDTFGRTYNAAKDLIALPEDDEDEMYAGDYFPRRETTPDISLEYLSFYKEGANEKSIALVTGIYETKNSADSALKILKNVKANAFLVKSEIFMGCMH